VIRADILTARFESLQGKPHLVSAHGSGATSLEQRRPDGSLQASSADSLDATFRPAAAAGATAGTYPGGRGQIDTASLNGHVIITNVPGAKHSSNSASGEERATAQKATYDARTGRVLLTGGVELKDSQSDLWADRIALNQQTGDASAAGTVKANFQQSASSEPVHVLADHADLKKSTDTAIFYGAARPARLWEGSSQIEAPVLQFDRARQRLLAHGAATTPGAAVQTVLVSAGQPAQHRRSAVIRISSHEMEYSNEQHMAEFLGGVKIVSADGTMQGRRATAYFSSPPEEKRDAALVPAGGFLQSGVERVVVNGDIEIQQQGRQAIGERLVYTASDGVFALTGTAQHPPRVMDVSRGTITGRELRFREQDASVVISNGDGNQSGPRVRTETRVKKEP
jgi:lipopolysaccharide export system protein LptA